MLQVCCTYSLAPQRLTLNLLRVRYLIGNYKNLVFDRQLQKSVCHNTTNKRSVQHFHPLSWVFLFTHYWHCTLFIAKPRWLLTVLNVVLIRYECWSVLLYQKLVGEASILLGNYNYFENFLSSSGRILVVRLCEQQQTFFSNNNLI